MTAGALIVVAATAAAPILALLRKWRRFMEILLILNDFFVSWQAQSRAKDQSGQPGCQRGETDDQAETNELENHERNNTAIDMPGGNFWWRHSFEIKQGKAKRRGQKRRLKIH